RLLFGNPERFRADVRPRPVGFERYAYLGIGPRTEKKMYVRMPGPGYGGIHDPIVQVRVPTHEVNSQVHSACPHGVLDQREAVPSLARKSLPINADKEFVAHRAP